MRPRIRFCSSTRGSFSTRCSNITCSASSIATEGGRVTSRPRGVMKSLDRARRPRPGRGACPGARGSRPGARLPFASSIRMPLALWMADGLARLGHGRVALEPRAALDHVGVARLHVADPLGLLRDRGVAVQEAEPALEGQGLGHLLADHRVHVGARPPAAPGRRPASSGIARSTPRRVLTGVCWGRNRKSSKVRPTNSDSSSGIRSLGWHAARARGSSRETRLQGGGSVAARRAARASTSPRGPGVGARRARGGALPSPPPGGSHSSQAWRAGSSTGCSSTSPTRQGSGSSAIMRSAATSRPPSGIASTSWSITACGWPLTQRRSSRSSRRRRVATVSKLCPSALTSTSMLRSSRGPSSAAASVTASSGRGAGSRSSSGAPGAGSTNGTQVGVSRRRRRPGHGSTDGANGGTKS